MGIGASIFMLAVGAIITFAFNIRVGWLDLDAVGWILMAAGAVGLIVTLTMLGRRRTVVTNSTPPVVPPTMPVEQHVVDEYDRRY
jgi:Domain of unknown function (DUF6458)